MPPRTRRRASSPTGRPAAITSLSDAPMFHNWLIHAEPGVGKTVLAGTAPKMLFLTIEAEGTQSAAHAGSTGEQWPINTANDFSEAEDYFVNGSGCDDYEWVAIDSASELEDKVVDEILAEGNSKNPKRSTEKMAIDDYQTRDIRLMRIIDRFNRLPINVIYTTHTMPFEVQDADGNDVTTLIPLLGSMKNGKLAHKVSGKVSMVGHLTVVRYKSAEGTTATKRRLYTEAQPGIMAKNRCGLGEFVDRPTIPKLVELADATRSAASPRAARRTTRRR